MTHIPLTIAACTAALALTGCGGSSGTSAAGPSAEPSTSAAGSASASTAAQAGSEGIDCAKAGDLTATPATPPPSNLPLVPGGQVYLSKGPFGKTSLFFEAVKADPTNLDAVRDQAAQQLTAAGYKLVRSDQEEGSEAEATLTGPHDVAIQVIQLCQDTVRVKYTLTS